VIYPAWVFQFQISMIKKSILKKIVNGLCLSSFRMLKIIEVNSNFGNQMTNSDVIVKDSQWK
jgi:hypothetical protein